MTTIANSQLRRLEQAPISAEREASHADARFYLSMVLVSAAIVFLGFAPSFYLKPLIHAPPALTQLTITHGVVTTTWVLLFILQASLIARKRAALHRQLGILGAILFGAMVTLGLSTAVTAARLGHAPPGAPPPLAFLALSLLAIVGILALVGIGLCNRRRSDWHKRLMLASLFIMTGNGTGRIPIPLGFESLLEVLPPAIPIDPEQINRTNTNFLYGVGMQLKDSGLAVRVEYERISNSRGDPDLLSAGLIWTF